ncbi:rod shape-determining protein MreC [Lachnospiraceae bacterium RM5]|nr:rod shape-determining protein MreC [Lachnospiraceae bacterium RM5]
MKKVNNEIPIKYIIFTLTGICLVMIICSFAFNGFASPVKNAVSFVVSPATKGMNKLGFYMINKKEDYEKFKSIKEENESLKKQIADMQNDNALSVQDQNELEQLRKLYKLDNEYMDYETVGARIISKDTSNWYSTFTIDKGSDDGIEENMNVIGDGGLVGIVYEVQKNYSLVRSIIDDESNVSAQFAQTSDKCIVKGSLKLMNDGVIQVFNINKDAQINEGDMIVTSNISSRFLPGILIGYVKDITNDSNNLTKSALLTPVVDFAHLDIVLIIKEQKNTGEE